MRSNGVREPEFLHPFLIVRHDPFDLLYAVFVNSKSTHERRVPVSQVLRTRIVSMPGSQIIYEFRRQSVAMAVNRLGVLIRKDAFIFLQNSISTLRRILFVNRFSVLPDRMQTLIPVQQLSSLLNEL